MAAFDPRDRGEVSAAKGNAGYGGGYSGNRGGNAPQGENALSFGRYTPNPTVGYPATMRNLALGINGALSPMGTLASNIAGIAPGYTGPSYSTRGFDYDPTNRAGQQDASAGGNGLGLRWAGLQKILQDRGLIPGGPAAPQAPVAPAPTGPATGQQIVPAATLGGPTPGLSNYQMNLPQYGYFGAPGQVRPNRAASLGGY